MHASISNYILKSWNYLTAPKTLLDTVEVIKTGNCLKMSDDVQLCLECFFKKFFPSASSLAFALCGITRVCNLLRSDCSLAISALFVLTSITP